MTYNCLNQARALSSQQRYAESNEICDLILRADDRDVAALQLKALNLASSGELSLAGNLLQKCSKICPEDEKVWLDLAYIYSKQGAYDRSEAAYRRSIFLAPDYSPAYNGIAVIQARKGDYKSAIATLRQAVTVNSNDLVSYNNLARLLESNKESKSAMMIYQRLLTLSPTADNYQSLIHSYLKAGLSKAAASTCCDGLRKHPKNIALRRISFQLENGPVKVSPEADQKVKKELEVILQLLKRDNIDSAGQLFEQLYRENPYHPLLLHDYGLYCLRHTNRKNIKFGLEILDRAVLIYPSFLPPYKTLANYFYSQDDFESAILFAKEGIKFSQSQSDLYYVLAMALKEIGKLKDAIQVMEKGLKADGHIPIEMYHELGLLYDNLGQFSCAKSYYQKALSVDPDYYQSKFNYGLLLSRSGFVDESILTFDELPFLDQNGYEALLYALACHPEKYRHLPLYLKKWPKLYAGHIVAKTVHLKKNKQKKIRIGYVSADLRKHPIAHFMAGIYSHHNKNDFEIYSYYNGMNVDTYTSQFKSQSDQWRNIRSLSDQDLEHQIKRDQIDILIDLSGHTSHNRLPVFVAKPAPVQVTYLGYLASTGIPQIDYRLIDGYARPDVGIEKLIELPNCYLCYQPLESGISASINAQSKKGHVTFGSFHRLSKIHHRLVNVWSEILLRVPDSALLMKTRYLDDPEIKMKLLDKFIDNGIDPERIVFKGHSDSLTSHLSAYNDIDIMLDAFPYNGTTITCESLWMGVPVVTVAGQVHFSRVGVSINTNSGLPELIGNDENEYVKIASDLAKDHGRLAEYNCQLRKQFLDSLVCDPVTFTQNLEITYRKMYHRWRHSN